MRALLLTLTVWCLTLPTRADASALRCGSELASEGSSTYEVQLKCGDPAFRNVRTEVIDQRTTTTTTTTTTDRNDQTRTTQSQAATRTIEEWTYNFGSNRLLQIAVFENGKLIDVRSGGYGR